MINTHDSTLNSPMTQTFSPLEESVFMVGRMPA